MKIVKPFPKFENPTFSITFQVQKLRNNTTGGKSKKKNFKKNEERENKTNDIELEKLQQIP